MSAGSTSEAVYAEIRAHRLIAIVRGADTPVAVAASRALYDGGVRLVEVTCNSPGFEETIVRLKHELPADLRIGAGTVVSTGLLSRVRAAGAEYVVAPNTDPEVVESCVAEGIAVIPGAATPTEVLTALTLGARMVKLFPAAALGEAYVKQIRGPLDSAELVAVGGLTAGNAAAFINAGCVGVGMGGGLVRKDLVSARRWDDLTEHEERMKR